MNGTEKYLWKLAAPLFALVLGASSLVPAQSQSHGGTTPSEKARRNVAIVLFDGVELLDFAGPGEVFSAAGGRGAFDVFTVGGSAGTVRSQGFVTIRPEYTIADSPRPDILVLPGGGVGSVIDDAALMAWIKKTSREAELVLSVCNGALVLAKAGLLDGLEATTHHGSIASLRGLAPKTRVQENRRFVDNGKIVTAGGVSAGIDAALHVVERLLGPESARTTARYMEYRWDPSGS